MVWYRRTLMHNLQLPESDSNSDDEDYSFSTSQQNEVLDEPKQVEFLKSFYGRMQFASNQVHPSLFQTLQKIEQKDGKETHFLACDHKPLLEEIHTPECKIDYAVICHLHSEDRKEEAKVFPANEPVFNATSSDQRVERSSSEHACAREEEVIAFSHDKTPPLKKEEQKEVIEMEKEDYMEACNDEEEVFLDDGTFLISLENVTPLVTVCSSSMTISCEKDFCDMVNVQGNQEEILDQSVNKEHGDESQSIVLTCMRHKQEDNDVVISPLSFIEEEYSAIETKGTNQDKALSASTPNVQEDHKGTGCESIKKEFRSELVPKYSSLSDFILCRNPLPIDNNVEESSKINAYGSDKGGQNVYETTGIQKTDEEMHVLPSPSLLSREENIIPSSIIQEDFQEEEFSFVENDSMIKEDITHKEDQSLDIKFSSFLASHEGCLVCDLVFCDSSYQKNLQIEKIGMLDVMPEEMISNKQGNTNVI